MCINLIHYVYMSVDVQSVNLTCETQLSCSGAIIEYNCRVYGSFLQWSFGWLDEDVYFTGIDAGRNNLSVQRGQFIATLVDAEETFYSSILVFTSEISLNNTKVTCNGKESIGETCMFMSYGK